MVLEVWAAIGFDGDHVRCGGVLAHAAPFPSPCSLSGGCPSDFPMPLVWVRSYGRTSLCLSALSLKVEPECCLFFPGGHTCGGWFHCEQLSPGVVPVHCDGFRPPRWIWAVVVFTVQSHFNSIQFNGYSSHG